VGPSWGPCPRWWGRKVGCVVEREKIFLVEAGGRYALLDALGTVLEEATGGTLAAQRQQLKAWAKARGYDLAEEVDLGAGAIKP
jgi:hypothetical protein